MSKIIFDIGANNGHTFFQNAIDGDIVYAFEPTPELINYIKKVVSEKNIKNYNLIDQNLENTNIEIKNKLTS